jgi:eukaryotic-like serine/threonine-protein kinase
MAPEQFRREVLTPAADVWAIGVVLVEAATGRLPSESQTGTTQSEIGRTAASVRSYRRRWPPSLSMMLDAALRLDPCEPPTVRDCARALEALL